MVSNHLLFFNKRCDAMRRLQLAVWPVVLFLFHCQVNPGPSFAVDRAQRGRGQSQPTVVVCDQTELQCSAAPCKVVGESGGQRLKTVGNGRISYLASRRVRRRDQETEGLGSDGSD